MDHTIVHTHLDISAIIDCPVCGNMMDLFQMDGLIEGGYLYRKLLHDGNLGSENMGEVIICSHCGEIIVVGEVVW